MEIGLDSSDSDLDIDDPADRFVPQKKPPPSRQNKPPSRQIPLTESDSDKDDPAVEPEAKPEPKPAAKSRKRAAKDTAKVDNKPEK